MKQKSKSKYKKKKSIFPPTTKNSKFTDFNANNPIDEDDDIVAGDDRLVGDVDELLLERMDVDFLVDYRNEEVDSSPSKWYLWLKSSRWSALKWQRRARTAVAMVEGQ